MAASIQVYRNLHKPGHFSIRQSGIVIDWSTGLIMHDCRFHVNENGRAKVTQRRRKGVHAWVVGKTYEKGEFGTEGYEELYFDPYFTQHFMSLKTGKPVHAAEKVVCKNNRCFATGIK